MVKNYLTKNRSTIFFVVLWNILFFFGPMKASAGIGDVVDFGKMELNQAYELVADFSDYQGYFVAPKDGVLTMVATSGCLMAPYEDAEFGRPIAYAHSYLPNGKEGYDINVVGGRKYYFSKTFSMNAGTCMLLMEENPTIKIESVVPEDGSTYSVTKGGNIVVSFNKAVMADGAELLVGDQQKEVSFHVQGANLLIDVKVEVMAFLENGMLKAGDTFKVRIKGIRAANNASVIYGTEGILELDFLSAEKPVSLISTEGVEGAKFLSYWIKGTEGSVLKFVFDGALQSTEGRETEAVLKLTYGNTDRGSSNLYTETVSYSVEGNTIFVDLSEKLRRPQDMLSSGQNYEQIYLQLENVCDATGNYTYNPSIGSLGSYSFTMDYEEVRADIVSEFSPAAGNSLTDVDEVEIWLTDYEKIIHQGIVFECTTGQQTETIVVNNFTKEADPDFEEAYILLVKVPDEARKAEMVRVKLAEAQFKDGIDHSEAVTATYKNVATAIAGVKVANLKTTKIYGVDGVEISADRAETLPAGLYIVGGKKRLKIK
ncbi:MAG: hypothetical protein IKB97_00790 [Bacteroidaceae bacterium]|nr:hypothetical protein [Bacteroidaceae bacterium]